MKKITLLLSSILLLGIGAVNAQYTILHSFNVINGKYPCGTLTLSGKTLYGTTYLGGKNDSGCIFSIDTSGVNFKDIYDFGGASNGAFPFGGSLKLAGNKLYGMTTHGGVNDSGCVYSVDTNGTGYRDLLDFTGANGANPYWSLTLTGTKLFGMTPGGGTSHVGIVFTVDTLGHNYKKLYTFTGGSAGTTPLGDLTVINDKLFGTTTLGGIDGYGNIFSLDSNGTNYTDLFDFNRTNGNEPNDKLINSGSKFYGMTVYGGTYSSGNVFSIDTNGANFSDIIDFEGISSPYGYAAYAGVIFSNGYLYGTTAAGGIDSGVVFKVDTSGAYYTDFHDFTGVTDGSAPTGDITIVGRTLYGTTQSGGANHVGTIFRIQDTTTTGINNPKKEVSMRVYPNPSNGVFTVQSSVTSGSLSVEVYNMLGEKIYSEFLPQTPKGALNVINISNQPNGVYLYRILTENDSLVGEGKLAIQK